MSKEDRAEMMKRFQSGERTILLLDEYQQYANDFINEERYDGQMDYLNNTSLGLCGEAGEFADLFKKIKFHGHAFSEAETLKFKKELGDVLWYVAQGCKALDTTLEDIATMNIVKLADRHGGSKFSEQASMNKDESKEAVS